MAQSASVMTQTRATHASFAIHLLSDGTSYWDGGGTFGLVPRPKWVKLLPPDDQNRVPQELRCVLIQADHKNILVDCGVGDKPNPLREAQYDVRQPNGHLLDDLARHGVQPDEIDLVIFTHLHGDHSGWATKRAGEPGSRRAEEVVPTFPNARYYVQAQEYWDATHPNERTRNTYFPENFVPLKEAGVLELLEGDAHITPSVRAVHTPGHTAGHQSIIVSPPSPTPHPPSPFLLLGDMASYMIHFARLPWVTSYDVLPMVTIETKRKWQQWAYEHNATLISCHDTQTPIGKLIRDDKAYFNIVPVVLPLTQSPISNL
jgi:glyoxylase-like metal-dependent hydrolase (beta-lactamase superfamily II)